MKTKIKSSLFSLLSVLQALCIVAVFSFASCDDGGGGGGGGITHLVTRIQ